MSLVSGLLFLLGRSPLTPAAEWLPLSAGEQRRHPLDLRSGEYIEIVIEHRGIDIAASFLAPDGTELAAVRHRQGDGVRLAVISRTGGLHQLEIRPLDAAPVSGAYTVAVDQRPGRPGDVHRVQAMRLLAEAGAARSEWTPASTWAAVKRYRLAYGALGVARDTRGQASVALQLGEAYHSLGRAELSLPRLIEALRLSRAAPDPTTERYVLAALARVHLDQGDIERATQRAREAVASSRTAGDPVAQANSLNALGEVYGLSGRVRESLDLHEEALAIAKEAQDRRGQARALLDLGWAHSDLNDYGRALPEFEAALALARSVDDRGDEARALTGLGHLHVAVGENQQALDRYREARELLERTGDRAGLGAVRAGMGMVSLRLGEPEAAIRGYREAVGLFRAIGLKNGEAANMLALGISLAAAGRRREALRQFEQALVLVKAIGDRRLEGRALELIGREYAYAGQLDRAARHQEEARTLARTLGYRNAEIYAVEALGEVLRQQGRYADALERFAEARTLSRESNHRFAESAALHEIAATQAAQGLLDAALTNIRASLDLVEALRSDVASLDMRATYLASVRDRQELEIDVLMRLHDREPAKGYDARAFEASERARARSLLDALTEARGVREGIDATLVERQRSVRQELNRVAYRLARASDGSGRRAESEALTHTIDKLSADYKELEARIQAESPRYSELTRPRPLSLEDVRSQVLDGESVLLQYFVGARHSYVWAVTQEGLVGRVLSAGDAIERRVRSFQAALSAPAHPSDNLETYRLAGTELARVLLAPVASALRPLRVLVVPDGILHSVPFAALADPGRAGDVAAPFIPMVVNHEVVHLPSASTLLLLRRDWQKPRAFPRPIIVFADPVFEADDPRIEPAALAISRRSGRGAAPGSVPRLIETRGEARVIAQLARDAEIALDFDASRAAVTGSRLGDYRVVHFATHGIVDDRHPELSGLVLSLFDADGRPQDGYLRLHDIYNLQLPVDLVVLSACSTALGRAVAGEGLMGLVRGFMYAGSPRVVATLWKVDDEATREFMTRFYENLFERKATAAAAMRAAQRDMWASSRWKSPFYWAAFEVQGEWR